MRPKKGAYFFANLRYCLLFFDVLTIIILMEKKFKNYMLLFWTWFKIGLFTFGGGYAMIALIQNEVAEKRKWIDNQELTQIIAIAESTPGPIAINSATYIGYKVLGFWGSVLATLGVVLPSFVVIYVISLFFNNLLEYPVVANAFKGIKAGVVALIIIAGLKLFKSAKKNWLFAVLFTLSFAATISISVFSLNFSTLYLILIGGLVGLFITIISNAKAKKQAQTQPPQQSLQDVNKSTAKENLSQKPENDTTDEQQTDEPTDKEVKQ